MIYSTSILAFQNPNHVRHTALSIEAVSEAEALGKAYTAAFKIYPFEERFHSHDVVVQLQSIIKDPNTVYRIK